MHPSHGAAVRMRQITALSTAPDPNQVHAIHGYGWDGKVQHVPWDSKKAMLTDRDVQHDGPRVDMKDEHSWHQSICFPRTRAYIFIAKN